MVEFVVDYGKTDSAGRRPTAGWTRPLSTAITSRSGRRWRLSRDAERRPSGNRQRHRPARRRHSRRARRGLTWWPSDIYDSHLKSIAAWRAHSGLANLRPPQRIDLADPDWTLDRRRRPRCAARGHAVHQRAAHLALARVAESVRRRRPICCDSMAACSSTVRSSATARIRRRATRHSTASLRAENPEWGVRDVVGSERARARRRLDAGRDLADAGQ